MTMRLPVVGRLKEVVGRRQILPADFQSLASLREAGATGPSPRRRSPVPLSGGRGLRGTQAALVSLTVLVGAAVLLAPSVLSPLRLTGRPVPLPATAPPGRALPATGDQVPPAANAAAPGPIDAGTFAPGACVAFPASAADRHQTVFLDAGHGGPDPGTMGTTQGGRVVDEAALTLSTALAAAPLLQARGYRVVVSRTANSAVAVIGSGDLSSGIFTAQGALRDLTARAACSNLARAAVLVGIHFNAGPVRANAGMLTLYDDLRPFSASSLRLASLLQTEILTSMNRKGWEIPDSGVMTDASAGGPALDAAARAYGRLILLGPAAAGYLATPTEMPGAVVEPLFLTNPFEASIAAGAEGQQVIAAGIAQAVDMFLGSSR